MMLGAFMMGGARSSGPVPPEEGVLELNYLDELLSGVLELTGETGELELNL